MSPRKAANIRNRGYIIGAHVNIDSSDASGVLFAQGSHFGGHTLYVKDNHSGTPTTSSACSQVVVGTADVPVGTDLILSASFRKDGEAPAGGSFGTLSLYHGEEKVAEGRLQTQPGPFGLSGTDLTVGRSMTEITDDYPGSRPWAFTGGTIRAVVVDVSGQPYVDLERDAAVMIVRE